MWNKIYFPGLISRIYPWSSGERCSSSIHGAAWLSSCGCCHPLQQSRKWLYICERLIWWKLFSPPHVHSKRLDFQPAALFSDGHAGISIPILYLYSLWLVILCHYIYFCSCDVSKFLYKVWAQSVLDITLIGHDWRLINFNFNTCQWELVNSTHLSMILVYDFVYGIPKCPTLFFRWLFQFLVPSVN